MSKPYQQVREFHKAFKHPYSDIPTPMDKETAITRSKWIIEEVVEFLFATTKGDKGEFVNLVDELRKGVDEAMGKELKENKKIDDVLVAQVDALVDINYFNYGSFTVVGVDPQVPFDIVQNANMGKLWDDNKPRFREGDGKIIKPPHWEENFAPERLIAEEIERQRNKAKQ